MQLTRLELYKRVCDRPLSKVAPELGISGTALAAICKQYQVPYPGSGYWTRKSLGLAADLPALPEALDEIIEITPSTPKPRPKRTPEEIAARKTTRLAKPARPAHHPLLFGVEEHLRKTRDIKDGEFLRPYKRILPDLISSEAALLRALSIANDLYLALHKQGYRVHIAQAADDLHRIHIKEQEVERKDRKYGRYHSGSIWAPDRPTVFYIDTVPIGLALTEMTERVSMRYLNGEYHREDSRLIRSAKPWQLTHSWTTDQDMPSGRFRVVAYSPKGGVDWSVSWQETEQETLGKLIPKIVETVTGVKDNLQRLMAAADEAEAKRKKEREEEWERYLRQEDARKTAQALADSREQLAEIIDRWGRAMTVERFFADAEERLKYTTDERRHRLEERLTLARAMMGGVDPLDFVESWVAPEERHRSKYA
ncbi:MAG: hypothetical protein E5X80_26175 [Mesorhizobium sp.]|uniref:hypothetical protein n=1 Tax=Mesorhizobium sp. TaxID=1871066 RepID=UPI00121AEE27|nr:hypothetical protein [Mesorhizobium sp.]TIO48891.1 MAG: hypothetical protein E5X78_27960 [Mesorhizobium sp.]TIO62046.1 MAG: hypothetical protein E5X79_05125 [Mesorhizobium sp.]TJV59159.1 MAG: hypothetical protein E5X80_26175 [Mesorhizobium sp.]